MTRPASTTASRLTIGVIAKRVGLAVSAIRYYDSVGLIAPVRRAGGRRIYDESIFASIAIVQLAQAAGFTLAETRTLVSGFNGPTPASARWQTMAQRKLVDVEKRIENAQRMKALLERLLQCRCETLEQCVRTRTEALRAAM